MSGVRITGQQGVHKRLVAIKDTRGLLKEVQIRAVSESKKLVPRKTGSLGRSITPGTLTPTYATVVANMGYAAYVELGTKPHSIDPVRKKILAWPDVKNGAKVRLSGRSTTRGGKATGPFAFARHVNHPGTKAQPYLVPGAKAAIGSLASDFFIAKWNKAD